MTVAPPTLDEALRRIESFGPEYGATLSSHVPMVLEALERMGHAGAIDSYLEVWIPRLRVLSAATDPELGAYPETVREMEGLGASLGPRSAVNATFARWAPGLHGAAFHGILRVAHAVRSLDRLDTIERRAELSEGLGYAIVRTEAALPGGTFSERGELLESAIGHVDVSPIVRRGRTGLITPDFLARLGDGELLARAVGRSTLPKSTHEAVRSLRRASLMLFVDGVRHPSAGFVLLHGVTAVDAAAALVPWLDEDRARELVRFMGIALLALRVAYVSEIDVKGPRNTVGIEGSLVDRAVRTRDDHAIKLAGACLEGARDVPDAPWQSALASAVVPFE